MGKSTDYIVHKLSEKFDADRCFEKPSNYYMDWILHGKREQIKDTECGVIKSLVEFDENADFNFYQSWSGKIPVPFDENGIEDALVDVAAEELLDKLRVPVDKGVPVGGWPTNGDTVHVTYGNFVVDIHEEDGSVYIAVGLSRRYELIKGKYHE